MMYYYYWQNYQIPHVLKQGGDTTAANHKHGAQTTTPTEDAVPRYRIPVTTNTA